MDVLYFLNRRMDFVRGFYLQATKPFVETMEKINTGAAPFNNPPENRPDDEPAFLAEWQDAEEAVEFLGQACVTFVAASLKLYLRETEQEFRRMWEEGLFPFGKVIFDEKEIVTAYEDWFRNLGIDYRVSGVDIDLIREIVVTRNLAQHPVSIGLMHLSQGDMDRQKFPKPFFGHPLEKAMFDQETPHEVPWMLSITPDSMLKAIDEVKKFGEWLDAQWLEGPKHVPAHVQVSPGEIVGVVTRYFAKNKVAGVKLDVEIAIGDTLRFIQPTKGFQQQVGSIHLNGAAVQTGSAGDEVGIEVDVSIRPGALVYRAPK